MCDATIRTTRWRSLAKFAKDLPNILRTFVLAVAESPNYVIKTSRDNQNFNFLLLYNIF